VRGGIIRALLGLAGRKLYRLTGEPFFFVLRQRLAALSASRSSFINYHCTIHGKTMSGVVVVKPAGAN
jgi:hypothetical protein